MKIRRSTVLRLAGALLLFGLLALLLSGCEADTPQNTFAAEGEVARRQRDLFYLAMWPALAIMIFVERFSHAPEISQAESDELPKQIHGNTRSNWRGRSLGRPLWWSVPMTLLFDLGGSRARTHSWSATGVRWMDLWYPEIKGRTAKR